MRFFLVLTVVFVACGESDSNFTPAVQQYSRGAHALYASSLSRARELETAVQALVLDPTPAHLDAARVAWLESRIPYGQTEAFRFYAGPVDDFDGPEGQLNGWPLDEGYIDYVDGNPQSGIINDRTIDITVKDLVVYNGGTLLDGFDREKALTTGYHAIEFLLWGQDRDSAGPGNRPVTDFDPAVEENGDRRGQYLLAATELLISDLAGLEQDWAPDHSENYRAAFEREPRKAAERMLIGAATLAKRELASERMDVPLENADQEDEHSCFSDNTTDDLLQNIVGIGNVWKGHYESLDGPGLDELVRAKNPAVADKVEQKLALSLALIGDIPAPFDQVILSREAPGWNSADHAVNALFDLSDAMVEAGAVLGIDVVRPEPEP